MREDINITVDAQNILGSFYRGGKKEILSRLIDFISGSVSAPLLVPVDESLGEKFPTPDIEKTFRALYDANIIKDIGRTRRLFHDEPSYFAYRTFSPDSTPNIGSGADFMSSEKAAWRALGEGLERYIWRYYDFYSEGILKCSQNDLRSQHLDLGHLVSFSSEQRSESPVLQYSADTEFGWIRASSLVNGDEILYPAQLFSSRYMKNHVRSLLNTRQGENETLEPMLRWSVTTGLGTGVNATDAIVSGILELIERDAFMISYLNKMSPPVIDIEHLSAQDKEIEYIYQRFSKYGLRAHIIELPTDFPVYVFAVLLEDCIGTGPVWAVGASADTNQRQAIIDALSEAFTVRIFIRYKQNSIQLPSDIRALNQDTRLIFWSKPENKDKLRFFVEGPTKKILLPDKGLDDKAHIRHSASSLEMLRNSFKELGTDVVSVNLSHPAAQTAGLHTYMTVAPELQPLHLFERMPYISGERLQSVPAKLGYRARKVIFTEPHPFP